MGDFGGGIGHSGAFEARGLGNLGGGGHLSCIRHPAGHGVGVLLDGSPAGGYRNRESVLGNSEPFGRIHDRSTLDGRVGPQYSLMVHVRRIFRFYAGMRRIRKNSSRRFETVLRVDS